MKRSAGRPCPWDKNSNAFTIVELLVVIVVIAILAAIIVVAYSGITQKAVIGLLQSDLSNASTALKAFQVENSNFPSTISTDCSASPDSSTNKCLKISPGNTIIGYSANNSSTPKSFLLVESNNATVSSSSFTYKVTDSTAPTELANTMQPGATPGASLELHAAKASGGTGPGVNSPSTTAWYDTSGNGNSGSLGSAWQYTTSDGWSGAGTAGDPYRLISNGTNNQNRAVDTPWSPGLADFSVEVWAYLPAPPQPNMSMLYGANFNGPTGWGVYVGSTTIGGFLTTSSWSDRLGISVNQTTGLGHYAFTFSRSGTIKAYLNGSYVNQVDVSSKSTLNLNSAGRLFTYPGPWTLTGGIVSVRAYPFILTSSQITANYNAGADW